MEAGTRVKLTAKAAKTRSRGYLNQKTRSDWATRTGVVLYKGTQGRVSVVWEGNRGPDQLQLIEIEEYNE